MVAILSYIFYWTKAQIMGEEFFPCYGDSFTEVLISVLADIFGVSKLLDTRSLNGAWWYISAALIFVVLVPLFCKILKQFGSLFWLLF